MWIKLCNFAAILWEVSSLAPPSFTGSWHHLYAKTDEDHEFTEVHNLGQLPVYVDIQVQPRNGDNVAYTFPGVGSAQTSSRGLEKEIGGVVYMYDANKVVVKCPDGTNGVMQVICTGEEWTATYKQKEIEAWIRVRVWLPRDFPEPIYSSSWLPVSVHDATKTHLTVDTGLAESSLVNYFLNIKVRVSDGSTLDGMVCDAQGSSLALTSSLQWGGVIYQTRGSIFYIWTPAYNPSWSSGKGSLCNMADGWGSTLKGYGEEGEVLIEVYDVLGTETFDDVTSISRGNNNQKNHVTGSVDIDSDIVTGKVYQTFTSHSETHVWPAFGGNFFPSDKGQGYGGVVFAYSQSSVRIWYPDSKKGFYIDTNWGEETSTTTYKDWTFVSKVYRVSSCVDPTDIVNGYYTVSHNTGFIYGTEVTYSCNNDKVHISGDLIHTCGHNGWNGTQPVCGDAVNCSSPPDVQNGTIFLTTGQTMEGDTANVTCNQGFNISGDSKITCQSDGSWSPVPTCNFISSTTNCSQLPDVQNGTVTLTTGQILEGDTANIICNQGFNISGNSIITCQSDGSWSPAPTCNYISSTTNCSQLPDVQNGTVTLTTGQILEGDTANIICNQGFNISGDSIITCQSDGSWSPAPTCNYINISTNYSQPPDVQNGTVTLTTGQTLEGDTANIICNQCFNISGNSVITCQMNGSWTSLPTCNYVSVSANCSFPLEVQNGSVTLTAGQTIEGDTANITCNDGFNISGDSVITCQSNGSWTSFPTCYYISSSRNCSQPPYVQNGTVTLTTGQTMEGNTVNITCNQGFNISGNSVITCQSNGNWTPLPTCYSTNTAMNCSQPPAVQNGTVTLTTGQTMEGDTANVACNQGFNISGDSIITCESNGSWSPSPTCNYIGIPKNCSQPPDVQNGTVTLTTGQTLEGDTANITCNQGFNISGDSIVTCQSDGSWSPSPTCNYIRNTTCLCNCNQVHDSSNQTIEEIIVEIVKNLTIETKSTSKYRRTKESAEDERPSAVTLGYLGGVVMGITTACIVFIDAVNFFPIFFPKT